FIWSTHFSGLLQSGVALALPYAMNGHITVGDGLVSGLSYVFSLVCGTWASFIKNMENYNRHTRLPKLFFRSFLFIFILRALQHHDLAAMFTSGYFMVDIMNPVINSLGSFFAGVKNTADDQS